MMPQQDELLQRHGADQLDTLLQRATGPIAGTLLEQPPLEECEKADVHPGAALSGSLW